MNTARSTSIKGNALIRETVMRKGRFYLFCILMSAVVFMAACTGRDNEPDHEKEPNKNETGHYAVVYDFDADGISKKRNNTVPLNDDLSVDTADDPDTNRIRFYIGHKYKIAESTAGYTKFYYDGYYPYNSTSAAYWMYCDFWASGGYPGVQNFY